MINEIELIKRQGFAKTIQRLRQYTLCSDCDSLLKVFAIANVTMLLQRHSKDSSIEQCYTTGFFTALSILTDTLRQILITRAL